MIRKITACLLLSALCLCAFLPAGAEGPFAPPDGLGNWTRVRFGTFVQKDGEAPAPIVWRVLSADSRQALLLSEYILFPARINPEKKKYPGWQGTELFETLNETFLQSSFTAEERQVLIPQQDGALVSIPEIGDVREPAYGFIEAEDRVAFGTPYAVAEGLQVYPGRTGDSPYWTRTQRDQYPNAHRRVIQDGKLGYLGIHHDGMGVRPLILIDLRHASVSSGAGTKEDPFVLSLPPADAVFEEEPEPPEPTLRPDYLNGLTPYYEIYPELTQEGFLPAGEPPFSLSDSTAGLWLYVSADLRIEIVRKTDVSKRTEPRRWFEADVFVRPGSGEFIRSYFYNDRVDGRDRTDVVEIARAHDLVFAFNGDNYMYRVLRNGHRKIMSVGIVLRGGEILHDDAAQKDVSIVPNRDIMALYPDASAKVYDYNEITARELYKQGVFDALCFGPILLRDGELTPQAQRIGKRLGNDPRTGLGLTEKGHYVVIMMEGRSRGTSVGCTLLYLAELFRQKGCGTAFNLDGGGTSSIIFMGECLNDNHYDTRNRIQNEVLGIGIISPAEPAETVNNPN